MSILTGRENGIFTLQINRPESKNAISRALAEEIRTQIELFEQDDALKVGIITGTTEIFSAGADLKEIAQGIMPIDSERGFAGLCTIPPTKPMIAAVEGYALGGGFEIALACDIIVASETARFAFPEVKHGLVALGGGAHRFPARIPYHLAAEILFTGQQISAHEAQTWGLVRKVVEPGKAFKHAKEIATQISQFSMLALQETKRILLSLDPLSKYKQADLNRILNQLNQAQNPVAPSERHS